MSHVSWNNPGEVFIRQILKDKNPQIMIQST